MSDSSHIYYYYGGTNDECCPSGSKESFRILQTSAEWNSDGTRTLVIYGLTSDKLDVVSSRIYEPFRDLPTRELPKCVFMNHRMHVSRLLVCTQILAGLEVDTPVQNGQSRPRICQHPAKSHCVACLKPNSTSSTSTE